MRRTLPAVLIAVLTALSLAGCGNSDSGPVIDQVREAGVLKVGTEGTYTPFSYQGPDGQLTGYDVDVIRASVTNWASPSSSRRLRGTRSSRASKRSATTSSPTR